MGSPPRRKYSSLKVSSEGHRKKKSRRTKSKKPRHRNDSYSSCSDDDESSSSSLYSSSSSDSEYNKSKRSHSRARSKIRGSKNKKRSRIRSSSEDDSSPVKKRKKSKRVKKIKKTKKKSERDAYISSASDFESCSTCKDEDSSSDEGGSHGRSRGRSRRKGRIGNKKNRSKTWISLPNKLSDSNVNESIEKVTIDNNTTRLKSVITVANLENGEEDDTKKDELKEETVYDYDDYPSCKSNDSNEFIDRSDISPETKGIPISVTKEVNSASGFIDSKETESNISTESLESILRQKALENLSRFKGRLKTKPVVPVDTKHTSDESGVKTPTSVSTTPVSQPVVHRTRFTWRRDPTGKDEKAATSSGSQPAGLKLPSADLSSASKVENNETSKVMVNTNNVDQNSTALVEGSSKEQQTESNDNSQFEKKTMSVMRGGEMVQVSYKVYIPNRAPALARRQLKR